MAVSLDCEALSDGKLKETCLGGEYRDQPPWSKVERRYVSKRPCRYQRNLKSLFVRCPLFRCGASPCKTKILAKLLEREGDTHTQAADYRRSRVAGWCLFPLPCVSPMNHLIAKRPRIRSLSFNRRSSMVKLVHVLFHASDLLSYAMIRLSGPRKFRSCFTGDFAGRYPEFFNI